MIAKQTKGASFSGVLRYLLSKEGAELIGGNMLGQTSSELAEEFQVSAEMRPGLTKNVYHASLSLPPGESLSSDQWRSVGEKYLEGMGFGNSQFVTVQHHDTLHSHIHMVASRVSMDGRVVSDSQDYKRSEGIVRGLEKEYGLTQVRSSRESSRRALSMQELKRPSKPGMADLRMEVIDHINQVAQSKPNMTRFLQELHKRNVYGVAHQAKSSDHISGIKYVYQDQEFTGTQLGKGYTWQGLQKRQGISFDPKRDQSCIQFIQSEALKQKNPIAWAQRESFTKAYLAGKQWLGIQNVLSLIPTKDRERAESKGLLEHLKTHQYPIMDKGNGVFCLRVKPHIELGEREWTNTKNGDRGNLVDFLVAYVGHSYPKAYAELSGNKRLLMLDYAFKNPGRSTYLTTSSKSLSENQRYFVDKLFSHLKIEPSKAEPWVQKQQIRVNQQGKVFFFSEKFDRSALVFTPTSDGYRKDKKGACSEPFFTQVTGNGPAYVYSDPFLFLLRGMNHLNHRNHNVFVMLDWNPKAFERFLGLNPQVKEVRFMDRTPPLHELHQHYKSFGLSIEGPGFQYRGYQHER